MRGTASCFPGPEMVASEEGLEALTGKHVHLHGPMHRAPMNINLDMAGNPVEWIPLEIRMLVPFSCESLNEDNKTEFTDDTLMLLRQQIAAMKDISSEDAKAQMGYLPADRSLGSIVGNIFVTDCVNTSHMDITGCIAISGNSEFPLYILRSVGPAKRGNVMFLSDGKENKPVQIRTLRRRVKQSWMAQNGNGYSLEELQTMPMNRQQTKYIVPPDCPIIKLLEALCQRTARETASIPQSLSPKEFTRQQREMFAEKLAIQRKTTFGNKENPMNVDSDFLIPVEQYTRGLGYITEEDRSNLTLGDLLSSLRMTFFPTHQFENPFGDDNNPELESRVRDLELHYERTNYLKFTLVIMLGRVVTKKKE